MLKVLVVLALLLGVSLPIRAQPPSPAGPEGRQLFNGHDLDGWKHVGPGAMTVVDGELHTSGGMGLLERQFIAAAVNWCHV